jgi:hypothetical protein
MGNTRLGLGTAPECQPANKENIQKYITKQLCTLAGICHGKKGNLSIILNGME